MTAADLDPAAISAVRNLVAGEHLGILVGAGASIPSGLPSWAELARRLVEGARLLDDEAGRERILRTQDPLMVAELVKANVEDDAAWIGLLRDCLYEGEPQPGASAMHLAVARTVIERPHGSTTVMTLNFDTLLEDAITEAAAEVDLDLRATTRAAARRNGRSNQLEVHHLHGVVRNKGSLDDQIVLSLSEFVGLSSSSWQFGTLQNSLQQGPLLIVGSSYSDPDVRQWVWQLTSAEDLHPVHALVSRADTGLDRLQFEKAKPALVKQWESIGVNAIFLNDFADPAQLIFEAVEAARSETLTLPATRLGDNFQRVVGKFQSLQPDHSDRLNAALTSLREELGRETNLTLWLCDGSGNLVRWAAADRVYRRVGDLRAIRIDNDSPWIASDSAARNEIRMREPADDPAGTRRWRSVVAVPVLAKLPQGPPVLVAVLSSATSARLDTLDVDLWSDEMKAIANDWSVEMETLSTMGG